MPVGPRTQIVLVAGAAIRRDPLWQNLPDVHVQPYAPAAFSPAAHLVPGIPLLLYQAGPRVGETLRFIDRLAEAQNDLCVILLGKEIGADAVARLLRHGAFDYLTWPCAPERLAESIAAGLANRRTFLEVRNLSDELARANHALARDRDGLAQCNRQLSGLNHLTQHLAGSLDADAIVKALLTTLPQLVAADAIGLLRTDPERLWMWSRGASAQRDARMRRELSDRLHRGSAGTPARRHLRLVEERPLAAVRPARSASDEAATVHDLPLAIGPRSWGLLRLEREAPFTEAERQVLATVGASLALALRNADTHQEIQDLALRDPLTAVLNRRALDGPLGRELKAGLRYGTPACLMLMDLDYFKTVNDRLGHVAGDEVLKQVATLVRDTVREVDSVGRYGGEEFAVVLPHTDLDQARSLGERVRAVVERQPFELEDGQVRLTASIGIASIRPSGARTVAEWIAAADAALYEAKAAGRNRVVTHLPGCSAPARAAVLCAA